MRRRFLYLAAPLLLFAQTGDYGLRHRCDPWTEEHAQACLDGKQDVWRYLSWDPNSKRVQPASSWGYKTKERAEKVMKADAEVCEMIERYFHHQKCPITYQGVFCAACSFGAEDLDHDYLREVRRAAGVQAEQWRDMLRNALQNRLRGRPGQGGDNGLLDDYMRRVNHARERGLDLEEILNRHAPISVVEEAFRDFDRELSGIVSRGAAGGGSSADGFLQLTNHSLRIRNGHLIYDQQSGPGIDISAIRGARIGAGLTVSFGGDRTTGRNVVSLTMANGGETLFFADDAEATQALEWLKQNIPDLR